MGRVRKSVLFLTVLGAAYVYVEYVNPGIVTTFFTWFQTRYPVAAQFIDAGVVHAQRGTLVGLALVMFLSRVPFNPFPVEPYILYAYTGGNLGMVAFVAAVFGTAGAILSYTLGRVLGRYVLTESRLTHWIESLRTSALLPAAVFLAAALPVPDISSFMFGGVRTPFKSFVLYSLLGFAAKVALLILAMQYFHPYVAPYVNATGAAPFLS